MSVADEAFGDQSAVRNNFQKFATQTIPSLITDQATRATLATYVMDLLMRLADHTIHYESKAQYSEQIQSQLSAFSDLCQRLNVSHITDLIECGKRCAESRIAFLGQFERIERVFEALEADVRRETTEDWRF
ncbi:hypothetical protein [Rhizobium laguerreae]|uniref:hypothetical protein n=1 Tax=Rhizobium laguerreae TaxID=1076926 RepID=UPI001441D80F|nr:hypothetical protein [Rhizobium laguerreae]NKM24951.1 hypothetical protein [Rhizobium laguerreae]